MEARRSLEIEGDFLWVAWFVEMGSQWVGWDVPPQYCLDKHHK